MKTVAEHPIRPSAVRRAWTKFMIRVGVGVTSTIGWTIRRLAAPRAYAQLLVDPGPAVMALRHRASVVWVSTWYDDAGRSCLEFRPPIDVGAGTAYTRAEQLLRQWTDLLWTDVSKRPAQWWPIAYTHIRPRPDALLHEHPMQAHAR